jgi:hypothetical protein
MGDALDRLTGLQYGASAEIWAKWWEKFGGEFLPPPVRGAKGVHRHTFVPVTYHKIPVVSHRILFLIDTSHSMSDRLTLKSPPEGAPARTSYLEYCKWELLRTLRGLPGDVRFNIIAFASELRPWQRGLMPLTERTREQAEAFLRGLRPEGATEMYEALQLAFQDESADTIYVLSDGAPNNEAGDILEWLRDANWTGFVTIHSICTNRQERGFMEQLAKLGGGECVTID